MGSRVRDSHWSEDYIKLTLSPSYLLILCVNFIFGLIKVEVTGKEIHEIRVARKTSIISHLFFAYDNLLFVYANQQGVVALLRVLDAYQQGSSQVVNLDKSEELFSCNVFEDVKNMIYNRMGIKTEMSHTK